MQKILRSVVRERYRAESAKSNGKAEQADDSEEEQSSEIIVCVGSYHTRRAHAFDPSANTWFGIAKLNYERCFAAACFWQGKVMVAGGYNPYKPHSRKWLHTVEQFDPETNLWTVHSSLLHGRSGHALVNFSDQLIAVGGETDCAEAAHRCVECFGQSGAWRLAAPLSVVRKGLAAAPCRLGIIVAGGEGEKGSEVLSSCELYDVVSNKWIAIKCMRTARSYASAATWTFMDIVYVLGGYTHSHRCLDTVEQYDPSSNWWTLLRAQMNVARYQLSAACVGGRIYVIGGRNGRFVEHSAECYDPLKKRFFNVPSLSHLFCHSALAVTRVSLLADTLSFLRSTAYELCGSTRKPLKLDDQTFAEKFEESDEREIVVIMGGENKRAVEAFDPRSHLWASVAKLKYERCFPAAAWWNGKVIVAGGYDPQDFNASCPRNNVEQFDAEANKWSHHSKLIQGRSGHALVNLLGKLYVIGGDTDKETYKSVECYDAQDEEWKPSIPMNTARRGVAVATCKRGIVAAGGGDSGKVAKFSSCEMFSLAEFRWTAIAALNTARCSAAAACYQDAVFVFGGVGVGHCYLDDAEQYDATADTWTVLHTRLAFEREELAAACVGGSVFLLGGSSWRTRENAAERFDLQSKQFTDAAGLSESFSRSKMAAVGFRVSANAFGRLFTHSSTASAAQRAASGSVGDFSSYKNFWSFIVDGVENIIRDEPYSIQEDLLTYNLVNK